MITKIETIWKEFENDDTLKAGILLKRYSPEILPDCFVSMRMPEKIRSIAFRVTDNKRDISHLDDLKDIKTEVVPDESNKNKSLILISLSDNSLLSIFAVLCEDLFHSVAHIKEEQTLFQAIQNRFIRWKELFMLAGSSGLSPEKQIGLFGELWLLKRLLLQTKNIESSLNLWVGPETGIRDFENNNTAIEVKTTQTHNHQKVRISSERQLDPTLLENLFLYHLSLEKRNGNEYSLNTIIEELYSVIGTDNLMSGIFKRKLTNVGYFEHHKENYRSISYFVRDEAFYLVEENFPRIEEQKLMKGVGDIKYSIVLSSETEQYKLDFNDVIKKIY